MSDATDYLENALVSEVFRATNLAAPATVYVSLHTAATTDAAQASEVTGGGYARQAATFGAPTNGVSTNSAQITFTNMPAVTVTHFAIWDALTVGNALVHAALAAPLVLTAGSQVAFGVGGLTVRVE